MTPRAATSQANCPIINIATNAGVDHPRLHISSISRLNISSVSEADSIRGPDCNRPAAGAFDFVNSSSRRSFIRGVIDGNKGTLPRETSCDGVHYAARGSSREGILSPTAPPWASSLPSFDRL